jgi:hypothetical protein
MQITRPDGKVTVGQLAELCGVQPITVYQWIYRGYTPRGGGDRVKLPTVREGRTILIDPIDGAKAEYATAVRARRTIEPLPV